MGDQKTQQTAERVAKTPEKQTAKPTPTAEAAAPSSDTLVLSLLGSVGTLPPVPGQALSHPTATAHQASILRTLQRRQGNAFVQRAITQDRTDTNTDIVEPAVQPEQVSSSSSQPEALSTTFSQPDDTSELQGESNSTPVVTPTAQKQPETTSDTSEAPSTSTPSVEDTMNQAPEEATPDESSTATQAKSEKPISKSAPTPATLPEVPAKASLEPTPTKAVPEKSQPAAHTEQPEASAPEAGGIGTLPAGSVSSPGGVDEPPAKPNIDVSSTEGLFQSLATVPASSLSQATTMAKAALPKVQTQEKADLQTSLPTIERPTGLPSQREEKKTAATVLPPSKVPQLPEQTDTEQEKVPQAQIEIPQDSSPIPPSQVSTAANEPEEEQNGSWWSWLTDRLSSFFSTIPTSYPEVSTSAGPRPQLELTGKADPNRHKQLQQASAQEVARQKTQADKAVEGDFGENDIHPRVSPETLRPSYMISPPPPAAESGKGAAFPPLSKEAATAFDKNAQPWLGEKVNEQIQQHQQHQADYQKQSTEIRAEGQKQIDQETSRVRIQQENLQKGARDEVDAKRKEWLAENIKGQQQYTTQAAAKQKDVDQQIQQKVQTTQEKVEKTFTDAEKQADDERKKTEAQAAAKKHEEESKPRSFWEKAKGVISSIFEALKKFYDTLYKALRWAVKKFIDAAKLAVRGIIELARMAVVGLIEGLGIALKGLVSVALAFFPQTAAKARAWIDDKVNKATKAVNDAAEELKKFAESILDAVGKALDTILSFLQKLTSIGLDFLFLLATGQLDVLFTKLQNMGQAAWESGKYIEGAFWEELVGFDISKPITRQSVAGGPDATEQTAGNPENVAFFLQDTIRDDQVIINPVQELEADDELLDALALEEGDVKTLGEVKDPQRGTIAIQTDLLAKLPQEPLPTNQEQSEGQAEQIDPETQAILDRLYGAQTRTARLDVIKDLLLNGIKKFWETKVKPNLIWLIPTLIVALAAFIALEIVTGGAITAALPLILEIIGALFIAQDVARVTEGLNEYLENGWAGKIDLAARGLAKAIARGGVALLMAFLFEVGGKALKAAFKGLGKLGRGVGRAAQAIGKAARAVGRGIVSGVLYIGKFAVKAAHIIAEMFPRAGGFILKQGKLIFSGLKREFAKAIRSIEEFFQKLKEAFPKFMGFIAESKGNWINIYAEFNPKRLWIAAIPVEEDQAWDTRKNARLLRKNMKNAKFGPGDNAHHLVPSTHPRAQEARDILDKWRIGINAEENGLPLSHDAHKGLHTHAYIDRVNAIMRGAKSRGDALAALNRIAKLIKAGKFP